MLIWHQFVSDFPFGLKLQGKREDKIAARLLNSQCILWFPTTRRVNAKIDVSGQHCGTKTSTFNQNLYLKLKALPLIKYVDSTTNLD